MPRRTASTSSWTRTLNGRQRERISITEKRGTCRLCKSPSFLSFRVARGGDGFDGAVGVKLQSVYAHFAVHTGLVVEVGRVDAMVHYIPFVLAGHLNHRVVSRAVDAPFGSLTQHNGLFSHLDGAERRVRCAVSHMVVGRPRVVYRPEKNNKVPCGRTRREPRGRHSPAGFRPWASSRSSCCP